MGNPIVMLAGLPGTGKSTIAKDLEDRLNYDRHSILDLRRSLGHKRHRSTQVQATIQQLYVQVDKSLQEGKGTIIDYIHTTPISRGIVYNMSEMYGVDVIVIETYCSERLAKKRMQARPKNDRLVNTPPTTNTY